jgi:hypothetical protein
MAMRKIDIHDIYDEQYVESEVDLDNADLEELLGECFYILNRALDIKQPQWLKSEVAAVLARLDEALSWRVEH